MGSVGINFGSATGGSGFDVTATVSQIVTNLKSVETPWQNQLTALKAEDTAFSSIGSDLSTLATSLQQLTDFQGVMTSKLGSSSNTNLLALTATGPTAVSGSHSVVVNRLAQSSSYSFDPIGSKDTLSGALTISVGAGPATTIPAEAGVSDTLSSYAAAINHADIGVRASVISDSRGSRLSIVSTTSGAAGQLTISEGGTVPASTDADGNTIPANTYGSLTDQTSGTVPNINLGQQGQDALLTVDGIEVDSPSNSVTTAIPGVTFQILAPDPNTTIQVQIANDTNTISSAFATFVSAYNTVMKDLTGQEGVDSSGNAKPLFGNPIVAQIQSSLSLALTSGAPSNDISSLWSLGISMNHDGTLSLNSSSLNSALNSNFSDVVGFLQNAGGFGESLKKTLDTVGNQTPTGALTLTIAANATQEKSINDNLTRQDQLIADQKTKLTAQLNRANQILQAIPQQLDQINQMYNAITGYNPGK